MDWKKRAAESLAACLMVCLLVVVTLAACAPPPLAQTALAAAPAQETPRPTFVLAPANATATPTPFQPLAPTPLPGDVSIPGPTNTPLPTPVPVFTQAAPLPQSPELGQLPNQINVLLLGADRRPWDHQFRTDTIMLVTLNPELGRVNITSFPRDLYITIPGFGSGRINTAWTYGGYPLLRQTFEHNFGVKIDYFALVEFSSFKKVIDDLGGLTVNVTEPVSDYRAGYWITIPAGMTQMDADTVLWYVRTRKTTNDIARNRRQQEVLQAIFDKLISMDALRRAPEFYEKYKNSLTTDMGLLDVLRWLPFAVKIAESRNIKQYYLTYNHVYDWITPEGAMVLVPQQAAMMQVIRKSQNLH
jgi:LCP family protein required for cell wall assembly